jgi:hypothetical protein
MRLLRDTWRRESRERPGAVRLSLIGVATLSMAAALAAGRLSLLAQLVAGLALLPLSLAIYLRLLPSPPWSDGRGGGGPGRRGDDGSGPGPAGGRAAETDWDRFERQFRAYVEEHELVRAREGQIANRARGAHDGPSTRGLLGFGSELTTRVGAQTPRGHASADLELAPRP